jgi:Cu+-exporting ATPase
VVEGARARGVRFLEARDVVSHPGLGLEAVVDGSRVRVGRLDWIDPDPASEGHRIAFGLGGRTILAVSVDGRPSGVLAVSDRLRPEARDAIDELHGMGLRTALLTGDGEVVARAVASEAGIPRFEASLMPVDKASRLASAAAAEEVVGMVGDGVNDAPALASAAVGFAIGTGSDVAKEAADVTIVGSDLRGVARAIRLSRSVVKGIRQNLFWAFAYNLALVPIAAGVLHLVPGAPGFLKDLHPALAAAAMALSSLTVVGNSLRLARTRV